MTGPSSTQIVSVSLALAGEQTGRIDTNHAGTPQARLHILWGALMLTLTSPAQTGYILDVWQRAALAARALPMTLRDLKPEVQACQTASGPAAGRPSSRAMD